MCRNIKPLFNFDPPAERADVEAAAIQYVRKVSGSTRPSKANETAFNAAVEEVAAATQRLLASLVTTAPVRNRAEHVARLKERSAVRYGSDSAG